MDKISKRSKGYAFIEYTTEEAAAAALKEMNGKVSFTCLIVLYKIIRINQTPSHSVVFIFVYMFLKQIRHSEKQILRYFCWCRSQIINGWMIVVDVAKTSPPRYSRGQSRSVTRWPDEETESQRGIESFDLIGDQPHKFCTMTYYEILDRTIIF